MGIFIFIAGLLLAIVLLVVALVRQARKLKSYEFNFNLYYDMTVALEKVLVDVKEELYDRTKSLVLLQGNVERVLPYYFTFWNIYNDYVEDLNPVSEKINSLLKIYHPTFIKSVMREVMYKADEDTIFNLTLAGSQVERIK